MLVRTLMTCTAFNCLVYLQGTHALQLMAPLGVHFQSGMVKNALPIPRQHVAW